MKYDFITIIDRKNTDSEKWDHMPCCTEDTIAAWVADMDFASPPEIVSAIRERLDHEILGYTHMNKKYYGAIQMWIKTRHGYHAELDWIIQSAGVVCSLNAAVDELLKDGGSVCILAPCYPPFFYAADNMGHEKMVSNLVKVNDTFKMDFNELEKCFKKGAKVLVICNPHNPVGRAWTYDELYELGELCEKYDVYVISDDIHCDLMLPGREYVPAITVETLKDRVIMLISATKTFNIAGLQTSSAIIPDERLREGIYNRLKRYGHWEPNILAIVAQYTAYSQCGQWLDELMQVVEQNMDTVIEALKGTKLKLYKPEATYLLWIDCSELDMDEEELMDFFVNKCGVCPNSGKAFGDENYVRLNVATPSSIVKKIAENIAKAL